jgi:SEC-C motif
MSPNPSLSATQHQVLALISAGFTATAAAAQAGVHRNTVANWLHSDEFRDALANARLHKQLLYWDEAEHLAAKAIARLTSLMDDPEMPPNVRLKATTTVLHYAKAFLSSDTSSLVLPEPAATHNFAQPDPAPAVPAEGSPVPPAVSTYRSGPKVGRNELCPCGSGIKFKRCCAGKTPTPPVDSSRSPMVPASVCP